MGTPADLPRLMTDASRAIIRLLKGGEDLQHLPLSPGTADAVAAIANGHRDWDAIHPETQARVYEIKHLNPQMFERGGSSAASAVSASGISALSYWPSTPGALPQDLLLERQTKTWYPAASAPLVEEESEPLAARFQHNPEPHQSCFPPLPPPLNTLKPVVPNLQPFTGFARPPQNPFSSSSSPSPSSPQRPPAAHQHSRPSTAHPLQPPLQSPVTPSRVPASLSVSYRPPDPRARFSAPQPALSHPESPSPHGTHAQLIAKIEAEYRHAADEWSHHLRYAVEAEATMARLESRLLSLRAQGVGRQGDVGEAGMTSVAHPFATASNTATRASRRNRVRTRNAKEVVAGGSKDPPSPAQPGSTPATPI